MEFTKAYQKKPFLIWRGQIFTIKECNPQQEGTIQFKEIIAQHISFSCADHVQYNLVEQERVYDIWQYLSHGHEGDELGFTIEARGEFPTIPMSSVGRQSLLEYVQTAAEKFGGVFYANNKHLVIYSPAEWYKYNGIDLRYQFNTDTVKLSSNTYNLKTYVKGFGKTKEDGTTVEAIYISPNVNKYGRRKADPITDERFLYSESLQSYLATKILDVPETSIEIVYKGNEPIGENEQLYLVHETLGYESMLNLKRMTLFHPYTNKASEIGFSNRITDMIDIQRQVHRRYNNMNKRLESTRYEMEQVTGIANTALSGDIVGEVT